MNKSAMISVEEATKRLFSHAHPMPVEEVSLDEAARRVLAHDLSASRSQPPFAASAMDGYAVRAADIQCVPVTLDVIGEAPAGRRFAGSVENGQAVRIFTGAPVPDGADAILIQENTEPAGEAGKIVAKQSVEIGLYVRKAGLDFAKGDVLLQAPRILRSADVAVAAAMNHASIPVFSRPKVGILATGDELVPPGEAPSQDQIICSNPFGIASDVAEAGGLPVRLGIAADTKQSLNAALAQSREVGCDILVTIGGASVGDHDLVKPVLEEAGAMLEFVKIAMRPGKPVNFGILPPSDPTATPCLVLGLPGNPVSSLVGSRLLLMPLIRRMTGLQNNETDITTARLGCDLKANDLRQDYLRSTLTAGQDGTLIATPFPKQDSSMLATFARSDCLVIRAPHAPPAKEGDACEIIRL